MNTNGAPNCTCTEEGRKGAKGTQWAEFAFDLNCKFHFGHGKEVAPDEDVS